MTTLNGIRDAELLVQFLGKKIAVREADGGLSIYPLLYSISHNEMANVQDSNGMMRTVHWSDCENPYIIFLHEKVEMK